MTRTNPIRNGDKVTFKPQWRDPGDEAIEFVAIEDEAGGRVSVAAQLGWAITPVQRVAVDMLETEGSADANQ